ncbi:hypothetical protein Sru01_66960 [Sphaerisporangium rufum]|uniref:Uncharacterized protein n=1 Tax=Sphaerisporangium rufum TaxID=1381558 RepID=A0A919R8U5_9ACTN|nr:hypothetical protein [Sphaerisporangium rufum]GII81714.1 hypothetical protein Sru01_66960 [Sphaerisporangium rufum]
MGLLSARWAPWAAAGWTFGYGAVQSWWLLNPGTRWAPPEEPFAPGRWAAVTLGFTAAGACALIAARAGRRWPVAARRALVVVTWAAGAGLVLYSYMLAISLASMLFADYDDWASLLIRAAGTVGGALALACAAAEGNRLRQGCAACGRVHGRSAERRTDPTPGWARLAGYAAVAGYLSRVGAVVRDHLTLGRPVDLGFDPFTVFLLLVSLAGTVLPLALVHRWGRIWPRWVVPLAGRPVPRWLVLGPGYFVGASLTGYFGLAGMTAWVLGKGGLRGGDQLTVSMEMFGYTVWGLGLLAASVSYHALTRPECPLPVKVRGLAPAG